MLNFDCTVTGGAGFLGSRIAARLCEEGRSVAVVDDLSTGRSSNVPASAKLYQHCASEPYDHCTLSEIYHFASPASPDAFLSGMERVVMANVHGTMRAIEEIPVLGGLLIFASSSEAYGSTTQEMNEFNLGAVRTQSVRGVYDEGKRMMEAIAYTASRRYHMRCLVLRIFNTYGPGMPLDGRVVNTFVDQAKRGVPLTVHGGGEQTRSFCYVDDTVQMIIELAKWASQNMDRGQCEVFNVGSPDEVPVNHVAQLVAERSNVPVAHVSSPREYDPTWRRPAMAKTWSAIGRRDLTPLEEGIGRCF